MFNKRQLKALLRTRSAAFARSPLAAGFEVPGHLAPCFAIGMKKPVTKNLYMFNAKNKELALAR